MRKRWKKPPLWIQHELPRVNKASMMAWTSPVLAFVALLCPLASCQRQYVDLVSSSPAVLDSPIKFTATLRNYDGAGPFVFQWCKSEGYFGKKITHKLLLGSMQCMADCCQLPF